MEEKKQIDTYGKLYGQIMAILAENGVSWEIASKIDDALEEYRENTQE